MSQSLNHQETMPKGLMVKTSTPVDDQPQMVSLGDYKIHMDDFLLAVDYVLTNTDLLEGDPRLQFVEDVRKLKIVPGRNARRNANSKRLG